LCAAPYERAADRLSGVVERLERFASDAALLERAEPALDERLALGIAVAAAAVNDPELSGAGRGTRGW
jgi:hypothetical protein